jgi:hypothetical protein
VFKQAGVLTDEEFLAGIAHRGGLNTIEVASSKRCETEGPALRLASSRTAVAATALTGRDTV